MKLIDNINKEDYDKYALTQREAQFLQSWEWGEFQKSQNNIFRIGIEDGDEIIFAATIINKKIIFNKHYFYCPRLDIADAAESSAERLCRNDAVQKLFWQEVKNLAEKENSVFLRYEPLSEIPQIKNSVKTIDVQPHSTMILDLEKREEDLLIAMHQKTRYNIRLAEKKKVNIVVDAERFEEFWELMKETRGRDKFRTHGKEYYRKMLDINFIKLYLAEYEGRIIAGTIISFFGDTATYIHGASSNKYRNIMAPYLLQWQAIMDAKNKGIKYYDFFGIDEKKWPGVTRFKKGFGGQEVKYSGTYDIVFDNFWYNVYRVGRWVRRII
ncbi:MAG: peptidoglycan bridge formation glycyltransferase FemA/FemB family protein [bacterium]